MPSFLHRLHAAQTCDCGWPQHFQGGQVPRVDMMREAFCTFGNCTLAAQNICFAQRLPCLGSATTAQRCILLSALELRRVKSSRPFRRPSQRPNRSQWQKPLLLRHRRLWRTLHRLPQAIGNSCHLLWSFSATHGCEAALPHKGCVT